MTLHQYCTFIVADSLYGVPVLDVQELLRTQRMTPVPLAPKGVCGLINLRGQIVPALESRERLCLAPRAADAPSMNVVLGTPSGPIAIVVDSIGDVVEVDDSAFEPVPDTAQNAGKELIVSACKLDSCLLFVLDVSAITNARVSGAARASSLGPENHA